MGQRIFNLSKWRHLGDGNSWRFHNPNRRMVALDVNCPDPVQLWVIQSIEDLERDPERITDREAGRDGELMISPPLGAKVRKAVTEADEAGRAVTFLAYVHGRDRVEFGVEGAFELLAVGGPVWVYTHDSEDIATRVVDPVIFTKIANRRERNPELEWMNYQMRLNQERMLGQLNNEMERRLSALESGRERYAERRSTGTSLGRPRVARPRAESQDDGEQPEVRQRAPARKAPAAEGGGRKPVSGERRKVKAPPISE